MLSRVTNDVDTIKQTMNQSLGNLVTSVTMFLGSLLMMFLTNSVMAATAVVSTILGFALMLLIIRKSQKYFIGQQNYLGQLNGHVEEIYTGHNVVKVYNGEQAAQNTFDQINGKLYTCAWKSQFLSGLMQPLMAFIGNLGYVAVCVVGAVLVKDGHTDFGTIVAFMVYVRQFTNPLSQIAQAATSLQSTAAASQRVFEFLDQEGARPTSRIKQNACPPLKSRATWCSLTSASAIRRTKPSFRISPPTQSPGRKLPL